jgi:hypothetical protein
MSLFGQIKPHQDAPKKPPKRFWNGSDPFVDLRLSHWVEIALTIALLGVGYLQWTVYRRQAGIMDTQTKIAGNVSVISDTANKLTEAVQRAFIAYVPGPGRNVGANPDDPVQFLFTGQLVNNGNTPTKQLNTFINCLPSDKELTEPWVELYTGYATPIKPITQFIGPHGSVPFMCSFQFSQIREMANNKLFGYLLVDISYFDRLEPTVLRRTQASYRIYINNIAQQAFAVMTPGGTVVRPIDVQTQMQPVGQHNCADEDCPKD